MLLRDFVLGFAGVFWCCSWVAMDAMAVASSMSSAGLCGGLPSEKLSSSASFSSTALLLSLPASKRRFASLTRCIAEPPEKTGEFLECCTVNS